MPLHVSSICAHHQEVKIALHNLWYHHTYRCDDTRGFVTQFWPSVCTTQQISVCVMHRNLFGINCYDILDFSCQFCWMFCVFIVPLFGLIFNVFYQIDIKGEAPSIASFSLKCLYFIPDDGRANDKTCRRN